MENYKDLAVELALAAHMAAPAEGVLLADACRAWADNNLSGEGLEAIAIGMDSSAVRTVLENWRLRSLAPGPMPRA